MREIMEHSSIHFRKWVVDQATTSRAQNQSADFNHIWTRGDAGVVVDRQALVANWIVKVKK
jgi:hypothetical protein